MNRLVLVLVTLSLSLFFAVANGDTFTVDNASANDNTTVFICGHPQLSPVTYCNCTSECKLEGKAIDLAQEVLSQSGYNSIKKCDNRSWESVLQEIAGNPKTLGAAAFYTPERGKNYSFSEGIGVNDTIVVYTINGSGIGISNIDDLGNLTGTTTLGDSYGQEIDSKLEAWDKTRRYAMVEECLQALNNGGTDYYIGSERAIDEVIFAMNWTGRFDKSEPLVEIPFRFITAKNSVINMDRINATLAAMT